MKYESVEVERVVGLEGGKLQLNTMRDKIEEIVGQAQAESLKPCLWQRPMLSLKPAPYMRWYVPLCCGPCITSQTFERQGLKKFTSRKSNQNQSIT